MRNPLTAKAALVELERLYQSMPKSGASQQAVKAWGARYGPAYNTARQQAITAGVKLTERFPRDFDIARIVHRMSPARMIITFLKGFIWAAVIGALISVVYPDLLPNSSFGYIAALIAATATAGVFTALRRFWWRLPERGRFPAVTLASIQTLIALVSLVPGIQSSRPICWTAGAIATIATIFLAPSLDRWNTRRKERAAAEAA
jgi:hypothetical protein